MQYFVLQFSENGGHVIEIHGPFTKRSSAEIFLTGLIVGDGSLTKTEREILLCELQTKDVLKLPECDDVHYQLFKSGAISL